MATLVVLCGVVLSGAALPIWLQPTIVGILWGGTLLCGLYLGAWGMFRASCVLTVAGLSILLHLACLKITNLQWADSLLLSSILLSCGWVKGRWSSQELTVEGAERGQVSRALNSADGRSSTVNVPCQRSPLQWSIGDMATITALAACMTSAGMQVRISPLLVSVAWAFLVGLMSCWTAYRWVWLDRWSMNSLGLAVLGIIAAIVYLDQYAPTDATWMESFAWLCAGPISVVASQATTVLLFLAIVRFELESQAT